MNLTLACRHLALKCQRHMLRIYQIYLMDDIKVAETSGRQVLLHAKIQNITPENRDDLYQVSGNSYTILDHQKKLIDIPSYHYLKINVMGTQIKDFNYGCLYFLITLIVIFFFPIFFLCTDCCKKKIYTLFNININVYEAMGRLIADMRPREVYIVVQDNYFNEAKCNAIARGIESSHNTTKIEFINISAGLNTYGHNYSDFGIYTRQLKEIVRHAQCRWGAHSL